MNITWEQEVRRREAERQWREYLETQELDVVMAADELNQEGMTPVRALKEVFPRAMPSMFEDGIMTQQYMQGFLELLEAERKKGDDWEEMINSFPEWIAYQVASTTTRKLRLAKDERGTGILMPEVMENVALFMQDRDIPFEINERLVKMPLHLLALQDKVQLRDHLQAAVLKELEAEGVGGGGGSSSRRGSQGASSSGGILPLRYIAPRAVYVNGEPWLLQARQVADAVLGRPANRWLLE
jgi:hypothetical protein